MALNEKARDYYTQEIFDIITNGTDDEITEKWLSLHDKIDDLYVELGERTRRIAELEKVKIAPGGVDRVFAFGKEMDIRELFDELLKAKKHISELESELEHSREHIKALRGMLGIRSAKENIELANEMYGLDFEVPNEEEPLPFSDEEYEEIRIDKLEDRHMQDCITISQLQTTIDTLVDRYAKLREMREI